MEAANGGAFSPPRANPELIGHERAERDLRRLYETGRLPHAILLSGPRGIGKATLAFRFARFVLAAPAGSFCEDSAEEPGGLAIDAKSGVFRRVAAGGHADLLTVERAYDPRRRRLRGEIVVDDVRQVAAFLHLTAAEGGWRVAIIDGAEEMNRNAANALLKILEEPPQHALLLLVSHNPGRLLPTIRSRCRRFALVAPDPAVVATLVGRCRPDLSAADAAELAALSHGSAGRALDLAGAGGLTLYREMVTLLAEIPVLDVVRLHAFTDRLVRGEGEDGYRAVTELLPQFLARLAATAAREGNDAAAGQEDEAVRRIAGRAPASRWAMLEQEIVRGLARSEALNLDRKQAMLGAFFAIAEAAR